MNRVFTILATLSLVLLMGSGPLYSQTDNLRVDVPFDFVLGGRTFPAGEYIMVRVLNHYNRLFRIQGRDTANWAFVATTISPGPNNKPSVIFRLDGQQYTLTEFSFPGTNESLIPLSTSQTVAGLPASGQ